MKDELLFTNSDKTEKKEILYSNSLMLPPTGALNISDKKINSFMLGEQGSNSQLKDSVASKYIEYIDQFKKNFGH